MNYQLEVDEQLKKQVIFSEKLIMEYFDEIPRKMVVRGGARKCPVGVSFESRLAKKTIKISKDVFEDLFLPQNIPYDILLNDEELNLGPIIGLLLHKQDEKYSPAYLKKCLNYTLQYPAVRGLLFVFSPEGIDQKKKIIQGYYFNPCTDEDEASWKKGVFPYPHVIYQRIGIKKDVYQSLIKEMGNKIFNYPTFNKLKAWKWLSPVNSIRPYLPETHPLKKPVDIFDMMEQYPAIFLKPSNGFQGLGIIKVTYELDGYHFKYNKGDEEKIFGTKYEAENFIIDFLSEHHNYLIQQSINLLSYRERKIDFRFIMQKDYTQKWQCTGVIARFGKKGNIDTNIQGGGYVHTFEDVLGGICHLEPREIWKKEHQIIEVCKKVCHVLDERDRCYGDFGFDIGLDCDLNIWVIEINNRRHEHHFPLDLNAEEMYYDVKSSPIQYAKALAGF